MCTVPEISIFKMTRKFTEPLLALLQETIPNIIFEQLLFPGEGALVIVTLRFTKVRFMRSDARSAFARASDLGSHYVSVRPAQP